MTNSNQENQYFNNSTTSPCYINQIKWIKPKRGDAFLSVKAALLDGLVSSPGYENIDLIVKGNQAKEVLQMFEENWPTYEQDKGSRNKIFANIRFGSIGTKPYLNKEKKPDSVLSGSLIKIAYCKVNDEVVYQQSQMPTSSVAVNSSISTVSVQANKVKSELPQQSITANHASNNNMSAAII